MSYSHRVAQYFHAAHTPTERNVTGLMSICINTLFDRWEFVTSSHGWVGISGLFLIEYVDVDSDNPALAGTPMVHTWSVNEEEGLAYRYRIVKNQLFNALDENDYRQLIGTLIALDSFYRNPARTISQVTWRINTDFELHELSTSETHVVATPYLSGDVVEDIDILVPTAEPVDEEPSYGDVSDS